MPKKLKELAERLILYYIKNYADVEGEDESNMVYSLADEFIIIEKEV